MKMKILFTHFLNFFFAFFILNSSLVPAAPSPAARARAPVPFVQSPFISNADWQRALPYLFPQNHPSRDGLDKLFNKRRAVLNAAALEASGFEIIRTGQWSLCTCATHPKFKGLIFKIYFDDQVIPALDKFIHRIVGANSVREAINRFGYQSYFKVPNKWLYPLPATPSPPPGYQRQNFILIEENMDVYKGKINRAIWKGRTMNRQLLEAFYTLLKDQGLSDSIHYFNVPFSSDGKMAFIDTEYHHNYPIFMNIAMEYFGPEGQAIWADILARRGAVVTGRD